MSFIWRIISLLFPVYLMLLLYTGNQKLVGEIGLWTQQKLLFLFGYSSWILPMVMLLWFLQGLFLPRKYHIESPPWSRLLGLSLMLFVFASFNFLYVGKSEFSGVFGEWLGALLASYLGFVGGIFVNVLLLVFVSILVFDILWRQLFADTGERVINGFFLLQRRCDQFIQPLQHRWQAYQTNRQQKKALSSSELEPETASSAEYESEATTQSDWDTELSTSQELTDSANSAYPNTYSADVDYSDELESSEFSDDAEFGDLPSLPGLKSMATATEEVSTDFFFQADKQDKQEQRNERQAEQSDERPNEQQAEQPQEQDEQYFYGSEDLEAEQLTDLEYTASENNSEQRIEDDFSQEPLIEQEPSSEDLSEIDTAPTYQINQRAEPVLEVEPSQYNPSSTDSFTDESNQPKYYLPPLDLLDSNIPEVASYSEQQLQSMGHLLEQSLRNFNIKVSVKSIQPGPVVTLFEVSPAAGVKVGQIVSLAKDLARSLSVTSVRVVEIIPGKPYIGIEIPNNQREIVNFYQLLCSAEFQKHKALLPIALGNDIGDHPIVIDLAKTPHLLVAGTTGSGKSVGVNSMILSLIYRCTADKVKLILIDPKMLELSVYEGIPHLLTPVITDVTESSAALKWAVAEMERRYKLMSLLGVRNIAGLNDKIRKGQAEGAPVRDPLHKPSANFSLIESDPAPELEEMPYMVIIIDEFADLMMVVGKQVEELIARLAQKARAAGIHLILATQRPSVNVITGLIKANIPSRVAFQVSTKIDSRTILDQGGAEQLLGLGDMLYMAPGKQPVRVHGAFVQDKEVHNTVNWLKQNHTPPDYIKSMTEETEEIASDGSSWNADVLASNDNQDDMFNRAYEIVARTGKASISRVQRELRIGYNRAARLIEELEEQGIVSEPDERGLRSVLIRKKSENGEYPDESNE